MQLSGWIKQTLMDYPDKIATVLFTQGCNFTCPYCHNPQMLPIEKGVIDEEEIFSFLTKNKSLLDGVVVSGGEPCLQQGLIPFLEKIKALGLLVKLDTNGSVPTVIRRVIKQRLVDYIAMDIKAPLTPQHYSLCAGINVSPLQLAQLSESIQLIIDSGIDHEFRTTVAMELLSIKDLETVITSIAGGNRYYVQAVTDNSFTAYPATEMEAFIIKTGAKAPVFIR